MLKHTGADAGCAVTSTNAGRENIFPSGYCVSGMCPTGIILS